MAPTCWPMPRTRDSRPLTVAGEEFACRHCKRVYPNPSARYCPADDYPLFRVESLARIGTKLNQYDIVDILGEGGMGVVYKARHVMLDRLVAIKILHKHLAQRRQIVEQFVKEARAASKIPSPHIVDVTDFGWSPGGAVYLVMEYLDGISLDDVLMTRGEVALFDTVNIVYLMASALANAHDEGIVHCDLKPENVMLINQDGKREVVRKVRKDGSQHFVVEKENSFEFVKLLDFGVATFLRGGMGPKVSTSSGTVFGTPQYMSPEQALGQTVDNRSDIYALGIMFYEMLTGLVPFDHERDPQKILEDHVRTRVPPLTEMHSGLVVDRGTEQTIMRCLEKKPARRFHNMDEVLIALQDCFTDTVFLRNADRMPGAVEYGIEVPEKWQGEAHIKERFDRPDDGETRPFIRTPTPAGTGGSDARSNTQPGIGGPDPKK